MAKTWSLGCVWLETRRFGRPAKSQAHSRGNVDRQRSRGGKVVPRDVFRSCGVVNTKFVAFDGM